jgi:phosphatidylserine/phosphatidylglycerophosphate/cardiolipin synthase-like enzyme
VVRVAGLWVLLLSLALVGCSGPAPATAAAGPPSPSFGAPSIALWQDASIFKLVGALIAHATHRVLVEVYEIGRADLVGEIADARRRGADVRVLTDPTVDVSRASLDDLQRAGVQARFYPVDDSAKQIDHVKLLIADGDAVVGGMNWGAHSDRNHDYVLDTRIAPELARVTAIFEQDWALAAGSPAPLPPASMAIAQTAPGEEIRNMLESGIASAGRRALAEVYTLTDPDVIALLADAHRRGADVRVLLDPNQPYNLRAYDVLAGSGVPVRWYPVPPGALLHAKIGLFDSQLVLGSANWTYSGLDVNHELDIGTSDAAAVSAYAVRFEADWARSPMQ